MGDKGGKKNKDKDKKQKSAKHEQKVKRRRIRTGRRARSGAQSSEVHISSLNSSLTRVMRQSAALVLQS